MERRKRALSLKTAGKNRTTQEGQAENATSETSNGKRGILKDTEFNRSNVEGFGATPSRRGSYLETLEKPHDQNERLNFHCSFENGDSPGQEIQIPCTQPVLPDKILEGVIAFIEVRSNTENRFDGISKQVEMLGAKVSKKFTPDVTHVIFKEGKKATKERALKKGIHLVSVLWVESCRQSGKRISEDLFPVVESSEVGTPLMVGRLRRTKSMQPKAFEEDVQNSADRGERKRKRKLQASNVTPSAVILCAETQDPHSPIGSNPMWTPHMVPDTPCRGLAATNGSEDKPIGAIKFSESDSDQSEEGSDDTPSSIRKMKKRLLSKSTPTRPPSLTLPELGMTPKTRVHQSPNEVFLTGSAQGKKRKRQYSPVEDVQDLIATEKNGRDFVGERTNAAGKLKVKTGSEDKEEMNTEAKRELTGAIDAKNRDRGTGANERPTKPPKKREAKTKGKTDISQEDDLNQMLKKEDAELRVSPSIKSGGSVKKRFSKTARLMGKVDTEEDFGDLNENKVKSERETGKKEHCLKKETGNSGKRKIIKQKSVKQEKLVNEDKLENLVRLDKLDCRVNGHESGKASDEGHDVDAKIKKECKESKGKNGKLYSEANEEDDKETCSEEEGEQPEESENGIVRKHKTKAVKKVKPKRSIVMTSMHFNEQDIVLSVARKLGGFFIEDRVSPTTTHVIAGSPRRTLNVLMAIAQGCWLVSPVWVMKSLEVGRWVDEEPYELSEAFPAAQLCRLERISAGVEYRQELFTECPPIFVSENCSPPSDSLIMLISLCGGKVSSSVRKAGICLGSMTRSTQAVNITEQWLLDCITQHVVLPFTDYALNTPAKRRRETSPSY